jgi:hypothetical protein
MSLPKWWGDWRQNLTPHTGDLQPTDLIECTQIVAGQPVNTAITGQQIIDAASGGGGSNPTLLGFSGILGTGTTGTTVNVCHSLLIPAGTLGTNNIMQVVFRMYRQNGNAGQLYGRLYFNTVNSLPGATLISSIYTMNGASNQYVGYTERNYSYNGITLRTMSGTTYSEYTTGPIMAVNMNRNLDNYLLFTMQAQNLADTGNIDIYKVFLYE